MGSPQEDDHAHCIQINRSPTLRPTGRQVAGGLGALCVLVIGLIGIPIVLASIVGWPLPHHVPSSTQAAHALGASIPDSFWPRLFATLAWLAWAYFVFSVVTGLVLQLRGRRPGHRSHLFGPSAMAALIAAVLILGQLRGAHTVANTVRTGPPNGPAPVVQLLSQTTSGAAPSLPTTPISAAQSTTQPATVTHTVVSGDTLWSIAVQYYGDGEQWPAIFQANVGLSQPGGGALTDAHWIYPGWSLTIPGATQAPPVVPTTVSADAGPFARGFVYRSDCDLARGRHAWVDQPCLQPQWFGQHWLRVSGNQRPCRTSAQREPTTFGRPVSAPAPHETHGARGHQLIPATAGSPPFRRLNSEPR